MNKTKHIVLAGFTNTQSEAPKNWNKDCFSSYPPHPGNKISHQNTLAWLILKSEEEHFLYKQVGPRPLGMCLFLICFCVVLWRFFFFSKHKTQETNFLNLVTAPRYQNSSSKKLTTWTKSPWCVWDIWLLPKRENPAISHPNGRKWFHGTALQNTTKLWE